jgi:membrane associated rhomboid family serine protease
MGLYDRDYAYEEREPGFHMSSPQSVTTKLVLVTIGIYLLQVFVRGFSEQFALPSYWFREPWQFYRLLTYGFLHDTNGIEHIFFNMIVLWMFGQEVERRYGSREYLAFYLTAIVFAGLVWSLVEQSLGSPGVMVGASGGISGLFALYALNFPHSRVLFMFIIPMPMWVAALIMIGLDAYGAVVRTSPIACTAHLAGALYGLIYFRTGWAPATALVEWISGPAKSKKPKFRVVEPEGGDDDKGDVEVDRILQKIQEQGQESLTWSERRTLEKASRDYQNRRR